MADRDTAFVGSIPENYDRYLGPLLFHDYADAMAARLDVRPGVCVLETACGTGIVTERLVARLAGHGTLVASDLNEPMLAYAGAKLRGARRLEWQVADGTKLPFDDRSFDTVVCQFGLMFFPDKAAGVREAFRVLEPGGRFLVSVWDRLEDNPVPRITHETIATFFPSDPPQFYTIPFSLHDPAVVSRLLEGAGFVDVSLGAASQDGDEPFRGGCRDRIDRGQSRVCRDHAAASRRPRRHQGHGSQERRGRVRRSPRALPAARHVFLGATPTMTAATHTAGERRRSRSSARGASEHTPDLIQTSRVRMLISDVSVRCTGHFCAMTRSCSRCSGLSAPVSVIAVSIRSSLPSFVSHSAQSMAWIFEWLSVTLTARSGHCLRRAYSAIVIDVQAPSAASSRS